MGVTHPSITIFGNRDKSSGATGQCYNILGNMDKGSRVPGTARTITVRNIEKVGPLAIKDTQVKYTLN